MKNLLLILFCLFAFSSVKAEIIDQKFNLKAFQTPTDFYGVIATKNNLIVHGSNGIYYFSSDKGNEWFEKKIASNSPINKLFYDSAKNEIFGFTSDGNLLISKDEGETFSIKKLEFIDNFVNGEYDGDYFYIRADGELICMNNKFEFVSKIKNPLLRYTPIRNLSERRDNIIIYQNKVVFNCFNLYQEYDSLRKVLFYIDKNDLINNVQEINSIVPCDTCKDVTYITNFFIFENKLIIPQSFLNDFILNSNFQFEKYFETKIPIYNCYLDNDTLYDLVIALRDFHLMKYDSDKKEFNSLGFYPKIDPSIEIFTGMKKFNDSCFVVCSKNNNIFISRDYGKTWSNPFRNDDKIRKIAYLNDSNIVEIANVHKIKFSKMKNYLQTDNFDHQEFLVPYDFTDNYKSSYFDDKGKLILLRSNITNNINYLQNILVSHDYGKTFEVKLEKSLDLQNAQHVYFDKIEDKFHNILNVNYMAEDRCYIFEFDSNMSLLKYAYDTKKLIYHVLEKSSNEIISLVNKLDNPNKSLSIIQSKDFFKTSEELNTIEVNYDYILTYNIGKNKDSILIITYLGMDIADSSNVESNIFLYVLSENKFTKLYSSNSISRPKILLDFEEHLYIVGKNCLLENTNRSDLSAWKKYDITDNSNWDYCESYNAKSQKVQVAYFSNANYPYTLYEISEDFVNELKNESQTENNNAIYTTSPYPIPAKDHIKTLVYWDNSIDFSKLTISVYDINGNLQKLNTDAKIDQVNSYSGFLNLDCTSLSNGVYIVNLESGGQNKSITIVVQR